MAYLSSNLTVKVATEPPKTVYAVIVSLHTLRLIRLRVGLATTTKITSSPRAVIHKILSTVVVGDGSNNVVTRSSTVRTTYNFITGRYRLVYILTIEGEIMSKPKEEKDVLTPAPEWVQEELPLSFS